MATKPVAGNGAVGGKGSPPSWLRNMVREREIHDFSNARAQQELNEDLLAANNGDYSLYHAQVVAMNQKMQQLTKDPHDSVADHISATVSTVIDMVATLPTPKAALAELAQGDLSRHLPDPIKGIGINIPEYERLMSCRITPAEKDIVNAAIDAGLKAAATLLSQDARTMSRVNVSAAQTGSVPGRP